MKSIEDPADRDYGARVLAACREQGLSTPGWNDFTIRAMEKASRLEFLELFKKHYKHVSYPLIELIRMGPPQVFVQRLATDQRAWEEFERIVPTMFVGSFS
jgi:hypothetical protein